jgi:hypothetical protein
MSQYGEKVVFLFGMGGCVALANSIYPHGQEKEPEGELIERKVNLEKD